MAKGICLPLKKHHYTLKVETSGSTSNSRASQFGCPCSRHVGHIWKGATSRRHGRSRVGKSVLIGMMARNSKADVNVIAMVGERGREVREFIEHTLGEEGLKKSIVVVATSDQSALLRTRAAFVATAIAEFFCHQGKDVLMVMDSVTRFRDGPEGDRFEPWVSLRPRRVTLPAASRFYQNFLSVQERLKRGAVSRALYCSCGRR